MVNLGSNHSYHSIDNADNNTHVELSLPPTVKFTSMHAATASRQLYLMNDALSAEEVLTPLFDADATPFPLLSPSPQSPPSPECKETDPRPLSIDIEEARDPSQAHNRAISGKHYRLYTPMSPDSALLSESPTGDDSSAYLSPDNRVLLATMRAELRQHRRILTSGIGSGALTRDASLAQLLPPTDPTNADSSDTNENDGKAAENVRDESALQRSVATSDTKSNVCQTMVCLPCGAVALSYHAVSRAMHTNCCKNNTRAPLSPKSPDVPENMRYTYDYLCCVVPIIPRSKLLPLWQPTYAEDADQQQVMLEVLLEKIRVAQSWDEILNSHSV